MGFIESGPSTTRPKEIIEQTFNVFCGQQKTMDFVDFANFCESSKRVLASDASVIFAAVVQNVQNGMDLSEFKAALGLLVKPSSWGGRPMDRRFVEDKKSTVSVKVIKPMRQCSTGRQALKENHRRNSAQRVESKASSTFRWSPVDMSESIDSKNNVKESPSKSRAIRWCPAELED